MRSPCGRPALPATTSIIWSPKNQSVIGIPTCCIVGQELICSMSPPNVKAYLLRKAGEPTLAQEPNVIQSLQATQPPIFLAYENSPEMFRLTYPLMQGFGTLMGAVAGFPAGRIDPMLLPAAPTFTKYLRPAVSTLTTTPSGLRLTLHQSLPNGNLGATLFMVACSLLPADADALSKLTTVAAAEMITDSTTNMETARHVKAPLKDYAEVEGPCTIKSGEWTDKDVFTVELGRNLHGVFKFYVGDCVDFAERKRTAIVAVGSIKNPTKEPRGCRSYLAFFDKDGKLVGCEGGRVVCLLPNQERFTRDFDERRPLSPDAAAKITSYRLRMYETEPLPEKTPALAGKTTKDPKQRPGLVESKPPGPVRFGVERPCRIDSFTDAEGPCAVNNGTEIELGRNLHGVFQLSVGDGTLCTEGFAFDEPIIGALATVKNNAKMPYECQCYLALFDKDGKLVGTIAGTANNVAPIRRSIC